jgi:hypothetical protein
VSYLLFASSALMVIGAIILAALRTVFVGPQELTPLVHVLANGWGFSLLLLAGLFLHAAADPPRHLLVVLVAMLTMAFKTANDLYGMLVLPPGLALALVADLVLSVGVLVGMLRELPATIDAAKALRSNPTAR